MSNPNETAELESETKIYETNEDKSLLGFNSVEYCKSLSYHTRLNPPKCTGYVNKSESMVSENPYEAKSPQDVIKLYGSQDRGASMFPNDESQPVYADFSELGDYQDSLCKVSKANQMFAGLDAEVRKRFDNKVENLYAEISQGNFDVKRLMTDDYINKVYNPLLQKYGEDIKIAEASRTKALKELLANENQQTE